MCIRDSITTGAISAWGLRISVALGVAAGVTLGVYRIVMGNPLHYYIVAGYVFLLIQTCFAPKQIIPLAYDSGGVTTSTVTVPLIAALGIGADFKCSRAFPLDRRLWVDRIRIPFPYDHRKTVKT